MIVPIDLVESNKEKKPSGLDVGKNDAYQAKSNQAISEFRKELKEVIGRKYIQTVVDSNKDDVIYKKLLAYSNGTKMLHASIVRYISAIELAKLDEMKCILDILEALVERNLFNKSRLASLKKTYKDLSEEINKTTLVQVSKKNNTALAVAQENHDYYKNPQNQKEAKLAVDQLDTMLNK